MKKNILLVLMTMTISLMALAQNELLIPDTLSGTNFDLTLQTGTYPFLEGPVTNTMGVNGNILGPTLLMNQGDDVNIFIHNQLPDTTTIHWHGMHVSPENDGGPHTLILSGETWNPSFTVMDKAGTYWYHPHLHRKTDEHVTKGIAGIVIVRDAEEAALALPRTYGVDDFPLVIQTKHFDENNQVVTHSNNDNVVMVNATIDANLNVPAQVVRFRLLNGSSQRVFNIGLSDDTPFYQIASDGGLLQESLQLSRLQLPPGARAEILIDFGGMEGQNLQLMSYASEFPNGIYGATHPGMMSGMTMDGYDPNPINGADFVLMQFTVVEQGANPVLNIPSSLVEVNPIPESSATRTRTLNFTPEVMGFNQLNGIFLINGQSFNMDVINDTVTLGDTEIWTLHNQSAIAHPFHIHDVQFFVLDRNGAAPPPSEQGRKDVILVKPQETVRFIAKFEDFASEEVPYMYHCHMLVHEDGGMMGQFLVVEDAAGTELNGKDDRMVSVFPNPVTSGRIHVQCKNSMDAYELLDSTGRIIIDGKQGSAVKGNFDIEVADFPAGIYLLKIYSGASLYTKKLFVSNQ